MKKAINLIIMYFVFLIFGFVLGTLFYSFYLNVLSFVAGQQLNIFDPEVLIRSAFFVGIAMCFLIFPLISFYRIRHLGGVSQTIAYIFLAIFTIVVLYPATIQIKRKFYSSTAQVNTISHLSGGYFRQNGDKVYYFTRDFASNPITGNDTTTIIIDTAEDGVVSVQKVKDTPEFPLYKASEPYKEILAKKAFEGTVSNKKSGFTILVEKAEQAFDKGFSFGAGFAVVLLALASIYAVTAFFQWKLINTMLLLFNTAFILVSQEYYTSASGAKFKAFLEGNKLMTKLQNYVDDPGLLFLYVIFSLILIITGIVLFCVKKHKQKA